jgi:pyruvate/2-oxoglutarate dehydrogenase complex dihydrolipoamide dehydrogenase (E3) component
VSAALLDFASPHDAEVNAERLRAKNFVIATGSRPAFL